jgi:dTMP kinase
VKATSSWQGETLKNTPEGKLIALDGPDGCGKSTQCELLCRSLGGKGLPVTALRDPGSSAIGEKIRQILLDVAHETMTAATEVLLYMAARTQLWQEQIEPALGQGATVVLDRWLSSTCAYQGHAGGFGAEKVEAIARRCLPRIWPDLTIILDLDASAGLARLKRPADRVESKDAGYHGKVREGFLQLARNEESFFVVDASGPIDAVHAKVVETIATQLPDLGL